MKREFDIKFRPKIESGEYKVQTRDGRKARIICWDRKANDHQIVVLVTVSKEEEIMCLFNLDGKILEHYASDSDLFIITPEPELTEFEKGIKRSFLCAGLEDVPMGIIKDTANELLAITKKELESEEGKALLYVNDKAYKIGFRDGKAEGYEKAMKEFKKLPALTWPPKSIPTHILSCPYNTGGCHNPMHDCINCPSYPIAGISTTTGTSTSKAEEKK